MLIIITTLVAMIGPRFAGRSEEAKIAAASADIQANIAGALDLYELDNGFYPSTEQGLAALKTAPTTAPAPSGGSRVRTTLVLRTSSRSWSTPGRSRKRTPGSASARCGR